MSSTNPFASLLPGEWSMGKPDVLGGQLGQILQGALLGGLINQPTTQPKLPPANTNPTTGSGGGASPFAALTQNMPQSGFARPGAQEWMQQTLSAPYMQGWAQQAGGANGTTPVGGTMPGTAPGGTGTAPGTGGPQSGSPYSFSGDVSPEAKKIKKQIKQLQDSGKWSPADIAKIVGAAALTYATGGSTSAILASAVSGAAGANKENSAANTNLKQYRTMKDQYLSQIGWSKTGDGAWKDASGKKMSTGQVVQTLMNLGVWG